MDKTNEIKEGNVNIDEGLYSRQLYVLGHEAMESMLGSDVLILGLNGLGIEISKNIILAGVKSFTVHDPVLTSFSDLSSQFYLNEEDIGKRRDLSSIEKLASLNQYVPVEILENEPNKDELLKYKCIILVDQPLEKQLEINNICNKNGIKFIAADIRGLFGYIFCDFGRDFVVYDINGEQPKSGIIASISKDKEGLVACLEDNRHDLEDGDYVKFSEIHGMEELNNVEHFKVKVISPTTFSIGDTSSYSEYISDGKFTQVKMPKTIQFKSLEESITDPSFVIYDWLNFDRHLQLHVSFQALHHFFTLNGRLPRPRNENDANLVLGFAKEIKDKSFNDLELDENIVKELSFQAAATISPMAAFIGGFAAQEVLKAISGKFHPIQQYLYFDSLGSLPKNSELNEELCKPLNTRYDSQIALLGKDFQEKLSNSKHFLVGAGAIGCEMLKNWAMMGLGTGLNGKLFITDMDTIERSNLNRQFLFRSYDVSKHKSQVAANAALQMNPNLDGKITVFTERVGPETENIYDDMFFESLDVVTNALDNVEARRYMDSRCITFGKPLLESGTKGTQGNVQVVVPNLTESYSRSQDPPEKSIPMCTLKNFPNEINHTIHWALNLFGETFKQNIENCRLYIRSSNYVTKLQKSGGNYLEILETVIKNLTEDRPMDYTDCLKWARMLFQELFCNTISQLLFNFPPDSKTSTGAPFWSGPKRLPSPLIFNLDNELHFNFIISSANLRAYNYKITISNDLEFIRKTINGIIIPEFIPKGNLKIQVNDNEPVSNTPTISFKELKAKLPDRTELKGLKLMPIEFEKDDDTNFHMLFITSASNLRASNYSIEHATLHETKGIAGKIIPAIATTTAAITGLVSLELLKILDGKRKIEDYRNSFLNLALPFLTVSEPIAAEVKKYLGFEFTEWDYIDLESDLTLQEIKDYFLKEKDIEIQMISLGNTCLYSCFMKSTFTRLNQKLTEVYKIVSKSDISPKTRFLSLTVMGEGINGENCDDIPLVRVWLNSSFE